MGVRLTSEELEEFFTEAQGLLQAGVSLGPEIERGLKRGGRVWKLWGEVQGRVADGKPLSEALADRSPQIDDATIALIRAGEQSGDLPAVLQILARAHRRRVAFERCIRLVTLYPAILMLFSLGVLAFHGLVVLPRLQTLNLPGQDRLPSVVESVGARATVAISGLLGSPIGLCMIGAAIIGVVLFFTLNLWTSRRLQGAVSIFPHLRQVSTVASMARWCQVVGHLAQRGVDTVTALTLGIDASPLHRVRARARETRDEVAQGHALSAAILSTGLLPPTAAGIIVNAERDGTVDEALVRMADHLETRLESLTDSLRVWLEPTFLILAGILVGGLVFFLYLPAFALLTHALSPF